MLLGIGFAAALLIVSEGMRTLYPVLAQKLCRLPGLGFLQGYEGWHRLDAAYLLSGLLVPTVCSLYVSLIRLRMVWDHP